MAKLIAILNVVAWSGFWAFGYLALTSDMEQGGQTMIAILLAAAGAGMGLFTYLWLARHSEDIGYAKRPNRATPDYSDEEIL